MINVTQRTRISKHRKEWLALQSAFTQHWTLMVRRSRTEKKASPQANSPANLFCHLLWILQAL